MPSDDDEPTSREVLRDLLAGGAFLPSDARRIVESGLYPDAIFGRNRGPRVPPPPPPRPPERTERGWEAGLRGGERRPAPQPIEPLGGRPTPRAGRPAAVPGETFILPNAAPPAEAVPGEGIRRRPVAPRPLVPGSANDPGNGAASRAPGPAREDPRRAAFIANFLSQNPGASEGDADVAWGAALRSSTIDVD